MTKAQEWVKHYAKSIGEEKAIKLAETGWWKSATDEQIFRFQMLTVELSCPFPRFHEAAEVVLKRPVWTHEFADPLRLWHEFQGEKDAPTMDEILNLIPEDKRCIVIKQEEA